MIIQSKFQPASFLKNAHLQTILPAFFRKKLDIRTHEEIVKLPDSDFVELAWTEIPHKSSQKPIVILLHGLEGSIHSHYIKGLLLALKKSSCIGVLMHFRNCGKYHNKMPTSYHSGHTEDFRFVVETIIEKHQPKQLCAVGFSLGGNVLTKYLGEQKESSPFRSAVVVSAPLDLASCSLRLNQGLSKIYQHYLLTSLKKQTLNKMIRRQVLHLTQKELQTIKTIWEFDDKITAPLNGFTDASDYYRQSSGKQFLINITTPTLFLHAKDDPFLTNAVIPNHTEISSKVTFEIAEQGGHIGFITGKLNTPVFWLDKKILEYLFMPLPNNPLLND